MRKQKKLTKATSVIASVLLALYLVPATAFATDDSSTEAGTETDPAPTALVQVVAPDGTTTDYGTLEEAAAAAPDGATITLLADQEVSDTLSIEKGVTLDGGGHTLTVHNRGLYLYGGDDEGSSAAFVLKNLTVTNPDAYGRVVSARDGYKSLRLDNVTLTTTGAGNTQVLTIGGNTPQTTQVTIDNSTLTASKAGYGIITFNPVDLTIDHSTISGYGALYMKGPDSSAGSSGSKVTISNGSVLTSKGIAGDTNVFGTVVFQGCDNIDVNVTDSTITTEADDAEPATPQAAFLYSSYPSPDGAPAKNDNVTLGTGTTVKGVGKNSILANGNGQTSTINATDGTYQLEGSLFDPTADPADPGDGTNLVVTGGSWNKDVAPYAPEGYTEQRTGGDSDAPFTVSKVTPSTDPDQPTTPDKPVTPDQPVNPGTQPDQPGTSTDPSTPDQPGTSTDPDTPGTPTDPDTPGTTDTGTQTDPDEPTSPDTPADTDEPAEHPFVHNGGTNIHASDADDSDDADADADASTDTDEPSHSSSTTRTASGSRYASVPQTGDPLTQTMVTVGGLALAAALVAGASLIHRKRAND